MEEQWRKQTDDRLASGNERLDALDRGQLHIISRLDAQDVEIKKAGDAAAQTLTETQTIRQLAENMQTAARFFNGFATFIHRTAKFMTPIIAMGLAIWGAIYAYTHDGKPPTLGD